MRLPLSLSRKTALLPLSCALLVLAGCSSDSEPHDDETSSGDTEDISETGGNTGTGGNAEAGTGGSQGTGTGGRSNSAGGSGGSSASGGESSGDSGGNNGSGGDGASGGNDGSGGDSPSGGASGSGGETNIPDRGPRECGCETPAGEFGTVNETIVVGSGEVYDGQCKIFRANPSTLGDGGQGEDQKPVFKVEDGGTLRNVVLGASAADGIHLHGDVTVENVHVLDIGEDAMTVKESGTVNINCGSAVNGDDKVFQVNAASTIHISHFTAKNAGKFMRQNGDTTFQIDVTIDHCDISDMDESIFRTDSSTSHVTLSNSRYKNIGDSLFRFGDTEVNGNSGQSTVSNNEEY